MSRSTIDPFFEMDPFSDVEFSTPKDPRSRVPPSSPISSALDSSPLKRMLDSSSYCVDDSIGIDNGSDNAEQTIEEEELEVVRGIRGVSSRLQERMAAVLNELRAQRMGVGTFVRAWVEQDDIKRARCIGLFSGPRFEGGI
jgi:hypothetical protein